MARRGGGCVELQINRTTLSYMATTDSRRTKELHLRILTKGVTDVDIHLQALSGDARDTISPTEHVRRPAPSPTPARRSNRRPNQRAGSGASRLGLRPPRAPGGDSSRVRAPTPRNDIAPGRPTNGDSFRVIFASRRPRSGRARRPECSLPQSAARRSALTTDDRTWGDQMAHGRRNAGGEIAGLFGNR